MTLLRCLGARFATKESRTFFHRDEAIAFRKSQDYERARLGMYLRQV